MMNIFLTRKKELKQEIEPCPMMPATFINSKG
jgi:hypothetical protein